VVNDARRAIVMKDSSAAQEVYAVELLKRRPELNLLVFGHTHLPVLTPVGPGRWYANPGAWMDGLRYLVVTDVGPALQQFSASSSVGKSHRMAATYASAPARRWLNPHKIAQSCTSCLLSSTVSASMSSW
jgi:hypothetical protein